jgi:leucyl-tRNA synthetase
MSDDLIEQGYGADSVRLMELFIGPWDQEANWSVDGLGGCFHFLQRVWAITLRYIESKKTVGNSDQAGDLPIATHQAIKKVSEDIEQMSFNTAVAALMEFTNQLYKIEARQGFAPVKTWDFSLKTLTQLLAPFAPHIAEELWHELGNKESVHISDWPVHDEAYLVKETVKIAVQVNGKLRGEVKVLNGADQQTVEVEAKTHKNVAQYLKGDAKKIIYVENKLINFVI